MLSGDGFFHFASTQKTAISMIYYLLLLIISLIKHQLLFVGCHISLLYNYLGMYLSIISITSKPRWFFNQSINQPISKKETFIQSKNRLPKATKLQTAECFHCTKKHVNCCECCDIHSVCCLLFWFICLIYAWKYCVICRFTLPIGK
jgi:hypothetical protein